jgi:hypothetical protein
VASWQFLIVGSFGALGAAMAVGTLLALLRYHRTGDWPGREDAAEISTGRVVALYLRVVVGAGVAVYAVTSLDAAGLL